MRTYKSHIFTLIIIFFNCYAFSQNTGSPYSLNELGEINFLGNVSNISMGGVNSLIDSLAGYLIDEVISSTLKGSYSCPARVGWMMQRQVARELSLPDP